MNTGEVPLGQILDKQRDKGVLKTNVEVMVPLDGKHGDMCVVGGFTTTMVQERARNHDPKHIPYGIAWRKQPQHATEQLTPTPSGIKDPQEEAALATTPPGLEQPIKEAVKRGRSPSSRELTSSASSHEGQLSQRPLQKDSLSARHASIISKFTAGMNGTYRVVLRNLDTHSVALHFREDVPGIPAEVMDNVDRFAKQAPCGPLYVSFRDDVEEKVQDAVHVKAAEEVDVDEEQAAAMDATERVESSDNATEREEKLRDAEPPTPKEPQAEVGLPKQTQPDPQVVAVRHERQPSLLPLEKVSASAWPATEQPDDGLEGPVEDDLSLIHI